MNKDIIEQQGRHCYQMTTPTTIPSASGIEDSVHLPEFVRLPKPGERCLWTGLSRASLNLLILGESAPVRSLVLRQSEGARGLRLIQLSSLLTYLHRQMADQYEKGARN